MEKPTQQAVSALMERSFTLLGWAFALSIAVNLVFALVIFSLANDPPIWTLSVGPMISGPFLLGYSLYKMIQSKKFSSQFKVEFRRDRSSKISLILWGLSVWIRTMLLSTILIFTLGFLLIGLGLPETPIYTPLSLASLMLALISTLYFRSRLDPEILFVGEQDH